MKRPNTTGSNRRLLIAFILFVIAVSGFAVFGDKGLLDAYRLKGELRQIHAYNAGVKEMNAELTEDINHLKDDNRYIAYIARKELGMIGRDEVLYKFD